MATRARSIPPRRPGGPAAFAVGDALAQRRHGAQLYGDQGELAEAVAGYLAAGLESGHPALVVARPEPARAFAAGLRARSLEPDALEAAGLLSWTDAGSSLELLLADGEPSADRFEQVVGRLVDQVAARFPDRQLRVYGDMVDVLWERGEPALAAVLEAHWNGLADDRRFALLCGYRVDLFDRESQVSLLPEVCRSHSHVYPARDPSRLHAAVEDAVERVLGRDGARQLEAELAAEASACAAPRSLQALMWISRKMPFRAELILAYARRSYATG